MMRRTKVQLAAVFGIAVACYAWHVETSLVDPFYEPACSGVFGGNCGTVRCASAVTPPLICVVTGANSLYDPGHRCSRASMPTCFPPAEKLTSSLMVRTTTGKTWGCACCPSAPAARRRRTRRFVLIDTSIKKKKSDISKVAVASSRNISLFSHNLSASPTRTCAGILLRGRQARHLLQVFERPSSRPLTCHPRHCSVQRVFFGDQYKETVPFPRATLPWRRNRCAAAHNARR
eukprot:SAG11_NODE_158_length_14064_cov_6.063860_5_plen_233_part_00